MILGEATHESDLMEMRFKAAPQAEGAAGAEEILDSSYNDGAHSGV